MVRGSLLIGALALGGLVLVWLLRLVPAARPSLPQNLSVRQTRTLDDHTNYLLQRYYQSQYLARTQTKPRVRALAISRAPHEKLSFAPDAEPLSAPDPTLTTAQKRQLQRAKLRLWVTIEPDGSHTEELIQSSGDREIDTRLLATVKRWSWKPALQNGIKVRRTLTLRYQGNTP